MELQDDAAPQAEKKTINVATAFTVIIAGAPVRVEAGVQKVDAAVADHWYAQAHLVQGGFGTAEYAKACRVAADAAYVKAKAAHDLFRGLEDAAEDAEEAAGLPVTESAFFRLDAVRLGLSSEETAASELLVGEDGGPDTTAAADLTPIGGAGDDSISAVGDATVAAGQGDDSIEAAAGDDSVIAGAGDDSVVAGQGDDSVAAPAAEASPGAPGLDAVADAYPNLSDKQEKALDRDGDGKPGGAPAGGNKSKHRGGL